MAMQLLPLTRSSVTCVIVFTFWLNKLVPRGIQSVLQRAKGKGKPSRRNVCWSQPAKGWLHC